MTTRERRELKEKFITIRVDDATHRRLIALSRENERTLAGEIRAAIRDRLERQEAERA